MALSSASIAAAIIAASPYQSQVIVSLAQAIGNSIIQWISVPTNVLVKGITSGLIGVGAVQGTLQFVGAGQVQLAFTSGNIVGQAAPGIASAIDNGLSSSLSSAQYAGTSAAVGTGTDISTIALSNAATLYPILVGNLAGQNIEGQTAPTIAFALAQGIANIVQTGFGFGSVTGPAGNVGASGVSISTVF